jgi:hypothetical protein
MMAEDTDIREISVDFARTIAQELCADGRYVRIEHYGSYSLRAAELRSVTQYGEDMIERYIRRAITRDRERRG